MKNKGSSLTEKLALALGLLIVVNIGILVMLQNQVKTIRLLKNQRVQLQNDRKIIASTEELYSQYEDDIDTILQVFPDESTVLDFIQTLERLSRDYASDSSVRLSSKDPLPESDKLFLLFNIIVKTNTEQFVAFLGELERLPYMTRTIAITTNITDAEEQIDANISLKLYVKNPFTAK